MSKKRNPFVFPYPTSEDLGNNNNSDTFQYKQPNNTGTILGIIGGVLASVGDAVSTIGAIIQLDIDNADDFQSQVDDFKSDKEKDKMQKEIDDLQGKVASLEKLIRSKLS
ncbi:hypothetical protein [Fictibacillus phosphorivorans]|uniref:hypothetical protein n=1 Tax=Fictibacillus phosphorivorans TaxID=1221500 RepID=UPI0012941159|nr:hypothetical protein [Fictibacillus phosphorivorans]MQR94511.1 hypothetical protein [Fictibacillus phosphorivorans]